ncbi:hypothetical protein QOZ80_5BG0417830 [Eleusine coracana subsp. coracana]|nr:hypothetical protein QOZ80_5BG0417830 [Eleusine coracana subsp. coracana]
MADGPTSPGGGGGSHESGSPRGGGGGGVREQDRFLPIANISRIMKKAIPANGKIAKDAKETVQECVSEFISFITSEASDKCQREKRKTINGDDLLWAMATLGFEDYIEPLKVYLQKYREIQNRYYMLDSSMIVLSTSCLHSSSFGFADCLASPCATMLGDSKLTAKAGDGSVKKDALGHGGASSSAPQGMGQQGAYNQGMGYMQPQYHNGDISN